MIFSFVTLILKSVLYLDEDDRIYPILKYVLAKSDFPLEVSQHF